MKNLMFKSAIYYIRFGVNITTVIIKNINLKELVT